MAKITRPEAQDKDHEKRPLLSVIRAKCLDCCVHQISEVRRCQAFDCDLWPYRMGNNPFTERKGNPNAFKSQ